MANEKNLRTPTTEEAREIGRKGGIASGEARRQRKRLNECFEVFLTRKIKGKDGTELTGAEALAARVFERALKGDLRAFELIRDTVGEKPAQVIAVAGIDHDVMAQVEDIVNGSQEGSNISPESAV